MKNKLVLVVTIVLYLVNFSIVYADDGIENIITKKNNSLTISKITSIQEEVITLKIQKILYGNINYSKLQLKTNRFLYYTKEKPEIGDFVLMSVNINNSNYDIQDEIFKINNSIPNEITLSNPNGDDEITKLEEFINKHNINSPKNDNIFILGMIVFLLFLIFGINELTKNKNVKLL